ncbi:MAG: DMT family transporter, partial [Burkholderiales bacterium]|nr:DMT family transporter [Burkholderiales bacterium]
MQTPVKSLPLAVGWMLATIFSFLLMGISGRELSAEIGPAQVVAFRNIICLAILAALLTYYGWRLARTAKPMRHLVRNAIHFGSQFGWFYAIAHIPIAEVFAIEFTTPIWTALLAVLFLGERLNPARVGSVVLGFTGVLVILRPGEAVIDAASLAALAAAFGYALTYAFTKDLVATDRPLTILLWMNAVQLPLGLAVTGADWVWPSAPLWPWVLVVGLVGLTSHYCLSRALAYGDATVVVPIDFLRLPLAAVVAWLMYGETVTIYVFLGAAIIFAGVWLNLRRG